MDRALDLKPEVTQGCRFESWLWQEVSESTQLLPTELIYYDKMYDSQNV